MVNKSLYHRSIGKPWYVRYEDKCIEAGIYGGTTGYICCVRDIARHVSVVLAHESRKVVDR